MTPPLNPGTIFEVIPFDVIFHDGHEYVSYLVPPDCETTFVNAVEGRGTLYGRKVDPKVLLKYCAVARLERLWDLPRCVGVAIKVTDGGRLKVRLKFLPPWYFEEVLNGIRTGTSSAGQGRADHLQSPQSMAGIVDSVPQPLP